MKELFSMYSRIFVLVFLLMGNIGMVSAQCDFSKMRHTKKDAICSNDGSITVSVPGTCDTQIVLRKADGTWVESGSLRASGANSTITFYNLIPDSYHLYRMDGSVEVAYGKNPVHIDNVYIPMEIDRYGWTTSTCANMADPDGTFTVYLKNGAGVGPFVYEFTTPRGKTTSPPTMERRYTLGEHGVGGGILPGETVSITVIDQKNNLCEYAVTQTAVIPSDLGRDVYYWFSSPNYIETTNCEEFEPEFRFHISGGNSASNALAFEYLKQAGNMTVRVTPADGSAPYTQELSFKPDADPSKTLILSLPTLKEGDKYTVTLKRYCDGSDHTTSDYTVSSKKFTLQNRSVFKIDPTTCTKTKVVQFSYSYNYYKLNDQNGTLKLYEQKGNDWIEIQPESGALVFNQPDNYPYTIGSTLTLKDWGRYKLVYTNSCGERIAEEINLQEPNTAYLSGNFGSAPSMHGYTRGIDVYVNNFSYPGELTFVIESKNGPETKTFKTTKPFSGETYDASITFPITYKRWAMGNSYTHFNDIPPGEYTITVTDACGSSASRNFTIRSLLEYHPKNVDQFENGVQVRYGCNNSNGIVLDFGVKGSQRGLVVLYNKDTKKYYSRNGVAASSPSRISYSHGMRYNNLPSGDYELHFYGFYYSEVNYSLILNEKYETGYAKENIRNIVPFTIRPYEQISITNYATMCDDTTDSGMIDTHITGGTPVYPIRYVLTDKATGAEVKEFVDDTFGRTNHLFTGLPKGEYVVRAYNGWNADLKTFCGSTEGDVVIQDYGVPNIVKSEENISVGRTATLSMDVSPYIYKVTWYEVVNGVDEELGTGTSIKVQPTTEGLHRYKAKVEYNAEVTPCSPGRTHTKETTLNVLGKNYWMGATNSTDWDVVGNWTGGRLPLHDETIEFATVDNHGTAAVNDLYIAQDGAEKERVIRNLINDSDMDLVITTNSQLTINGTVTDNNPNKGTIVVKASPTAPSGTLLFGNPANSKNVDAKVEFYSQAYECADCGMFRKGWQYFGVPVQEGAFPYGDVVGDETINVWTEPHNGDKWQPVGASDNLTAFKGYQITNNVTTKPTDVYTFSGKLRTGDASLSLTRTNGVNYPGVHLVANSYTAALPINSQAINLPAAVEQTVYLFNTGTRDSWRKLNGHAINQQGYRSGQYLAVPLNLGGTAHFPDRIPSMHAFMLLPSNLSGTGDLGGMVLRYSRLVKNSEVKLGDGSTMITTRAATDEVAQPKESSSLPSVLIDVIGKESADRVWLFQQAGTTLGYDDGWDGRKMEERHLAQLYVLGEDESKLQVSTSSTLDNLQLGFSPDVDGEYTLEFALSEEWQSEELFLHDQLTGTKQKIADGGSYQFTAKKSDAPNRFSLSATTNFRAGDASQITLSTTPDGILIVTNSSDLSCSVFISDLKGQQVRRIEVPAQSESKVEGIARGIYIIRLQNAMVNDVIKVDL